MRLRILPAALAATLISIGRATAQGPVVTVDGTVYDSLRATPLAGALVALVGTSRSTITDSAGRFHFDNLAPNSYTFTAQHDALDSAGFSGLSVKARVDGTQQVRIALPSFATLWHAACGDRPAPTDSGFVFGTVRATEDGRGTADAKVTAAWTDVTASKTDGVKQRRYRLETTSDAKGGFELCGVPRDAELEVQAASATATSGTIDLAPGVALRRIDLVVARTAAGAAAHGTVVGTITGVSGAPVREARVLMEDVPETRSDSAGRFILREVPAGTRQLEVLAIGLAPTTQTVDVVSGDTAVVVVNIHKAVMLETVKVSATRQERIAREIDSRRKLGFGSYADSTQLASRGTIASVFTGFPSVRVTNLNRSGLSNYVVLLPNGAGNCQAILYIDGARVRGDMINTIQPEDIGAIEVYPHKLTVPAELSVAGSPCGVVAIWTKQGLRP